MSLCPWSNVSTPSGLVEVAEPPRDDVFSVRDCDGVLDVRLFICSRCHASETYTKDSASFPSYFIGTLDSLVALCPISVNRIYITRLFSRFGRLYRVTSERLELSTMTDRYSGVSLVAVNVVCGYEVLLVATRSCINTLHMKAFRAGTIAHRQ
jgi:hypothetical protein